MAASAGVTAAFIYSQSRPQFARNWHSNAHMKYPASANYPDLSEHNNMLADFLTPGVRTSSGVTKDSEVFGVGDSL